MAHKAPRHSSSDPVRTSRPWLGWSTARPMVDPVDQLAISGGGSALVRDVLRHGDARSSGFRSEGPSPLPRRKFGSAMVRRRRFDLRKPTPVAGARAGLRLRVPPGPGALRLAGARTSFIQTEVGRRKGVGRCGRRARKLPVWFKPTMLWVRTARTKGSARRRPTSIDRLRPHGGEPDPASRRHNPNLTCPVVHSSER